MNDLDDYPTAHAGCVRAAGLCARAGRHGVTRLADFGAAAMLLATAGTEPARNFVEDLLAPIQALDAAKKESLLATLNAYLACGGRPAAAARTLGIHVSTLRYRLDRIAGLLCQDLDDPETRFSLQVALRLDPLLSGPDTPADRRS